MWLAGVDVDAAFLPALFFCAAPAAARMGLALAAGIKLAVYGTGGKPFLQCVETYFCIYPKPHVEPGAHLWYHFIIYSLP